MGWNEQEEMLSVSSDINLMNREGWVAIRDNETTRAEGLFRSVLQQNPTHISALYGLGYVLKCVTMRY